MTSGMPCLLCYSLVVVVTDLNYAYGTFHTRNLDLLPQQQVNNITNRESNDKATAAAGLLIGS